LTVEVWRRLGAGQAAFVAGSLAMAYLTGINGCGRYVAVLFPLFLVAGQAVTSRRWFVVFGAASGALQLYFAYWFSHWKPIT
jgi:hypothetical protein